jgi:23S rRNA U2552 (ribose-2'-O)-methylase RlmE/FtsJ
MLNYVVEQVAAELTKPRGRVLGVDLLPVQPPKGVSTIQGDFLSPDIQAEIKAFLRDPDRGRLRRPSLFENAEGETLDQQSLEDEATGYLDRESHETALDDKETGKEHEDKCVDVVLSDMWEPWDPLDGLYKKSISNPYHRLMNTSGNAFRDHAGSMVRYRVLGHKYTEALLINLPTGPLPLSSTFQLRHAQSRWSLRVQVLPGRRGQGAGKSPEGHVHQGPP